MAELPKDGIVWDTKEFIHRFAAIYRDVCKLANNLKVPEITKDQQLQLIAYKNYRTEKNNNEPVNDSKQKNVQYHDAGKEGKQKITANAEENEKIKNAELHKKSEESLEDAVKKLHILPENIEFLVKKESDKKEENEKPKQNASDDEGAGELDLVFDSKDMQLMAEIFHETADEELIYEHVDVESDEEELIYEDVDVESDDEEDFSNSIGVHFNKTSPAGLPPFLPLYMPSAEICLAQKFNYSEKSLADVNDTFRDYLKTGNLSSNNISDVLKVVLQIEDLTDMILYVPLLQKNILLEPDPNGYRVPINDVPNIMDLLEPGIDEAVLVPNYVSLDSEMSLQKHDIDILAPHANEDFRCSSDIRRFIANIHEVSRNTVILKFHTKTVRKVDFSRKYHIIFRPRRTPIRYQHRALDILTSDVKIRNYLFPTFNPQKQLSKIKLQLINAEIGGNPEQLQAVRNIVSGPNPYAPYVLFGPPGTGKTTTLVEAILQLRLRNPRSRILVTAGSNSACDTIALRICNYLLDNPLPDKEMQKRSLYRVYSKSVERKGIKLMNPVLKSFSNCHEGYHEWSDSEDLQKYGIVVATLCTAGGIATTINELDFFTHVFIDEAGASTEPETLVGMMGITSGQCRVILSGDDKQLGAVVKSPDAIKLGLEHSMLKRLLARPCYAVDAVGNYDSSLQTRLRRNYRSHPEIVRLYNHLYYNDELVAAAQKGSYRSFENWKVLSNPDFPIIFQAVHGCVDKDVETPSVSNELEIQVLMWYMRELLVKGIKNAEGERKQPINQKDIGVITPYKSQCRLIKQQLFRHNWKDVEVGSVETYQGCEKPVIIVSLVRSFSSLGFVRSPRRLNVVLSRAKSLLIILGNPVTLSRNSDFKFIIDECASKGTLRRKKKKASSKSLLQRPMADSWRRPSSSTSSGSSTGSLQSSAESLLSSIESSSSRLESLSSSLAEPTCSDFSSTAKSTDVKLRYTVPQLRALNHSDISLKGIPEKLSRLMIAPKHPDNFSLADTTAN